MKANALSTLIRFAAIRQGVAAPYIDQSTLSDSPDGARLIADREDARNRMAIRRREQKAHLRIDEVEIRSRRTVLDGWRRDAK